MCQVSAILKKFTFCNFLYVNTLMLMAKYISDKSNQYVGSRMETKYLFKHNIYSKVIMMIIWIMSVLKYKVTNIKVFKTNKMQCHRPILSQYLRLLRKMMWIISSSWWEIVSFFFIPISVLNMFTFDLCRTAWVHTLCRIF